VCHFLFPYHSKIIPGYFVRFRVVSKRAQAFLVGVAHSWTLRKASSGGTSVGGDTKSSSALLSLLVSLSSTMAMRCGSSSYDGPTILQRFIIFSVTGHSSVEVPKVWQRTMASSSLVRKHMRRSSTPLHHVSLHASPWASRAHSSPNSAAGMQTCAPMNELGGCCRRCFCRCATHDHVRKPLGLPLWIVNLKINVGLAHRISVP